MDQISTVGLLGKSVQSSGLTEFELIPEKILAAFQVAGVAGGF